jgi:hypothetical protein
MSPTGEIQKVRLMGMSCGLRTLAANILDIGTKS